MEQEYDVIQAHRFSIHNKAQLLKNEKCGCFYCLKIYSPKEITNWVDDASGTALCPYCYIDSVIVESARFPITRGFLKQMHDYWFGDSD